MTFQLLNACRRPIRAARFSPYLVGLACFTYLHAQSPSREYIRLGDRIIAVENQASVVPVTITTGSPLPSGIVNTAYSTTLAASGGNAPYSWTVSSGGLPTGLTLSSAGTISGAPTVTGTFNPVIQVADSTALTATKTLSITIGTAGQVTITTPSLPGGVVSTSYSTALGANGGQTPYSWSISSGSLPSGLSLAGSTGVISGTPTATGTTTFTVKVTDSTTPTHLTATQQLSIIISAGGQGQLTITPTSLPGGTVDVPWADSVIASGGTYPYSYSVAGGLPPGLRLYPGGTISGTPTNTGTYSFTIQASDSTTPTPKTGSQPLSITITSGPPLTITTTSLPGGAISTPYSATLQASGGTSPYTWMVSGTLPTGLTLAAGGAISGTPTAANTFNFTVKVTDSSTPTAQTVTKALSIVISSSPPDLHLTNITISNYSVTYQATNSITADTNVNINGSASVTFKAGNYIVLRLGFGAVGGGAAQTFHAYIGP